MANSPFPAGIGTPPPIGGSSAPKMPPPGADSPDSDDTGGAPAVKPEAVNYYQGARPCSSCEYFGEGGQCAILKMQVDGGDHCNAWESGDESGEGEAPEGDMSSGDMASSMPAGSSGGYPQ